MNLIPYHSRRKTQLALLVCCFFVLSCSKSKPQMVEAPPAYQPPPAPVAIVPTTVVPAKLNEVEDALQRVFKGAVVLDQNLKPAFFAGDFNGDAVQDIAAVIRPAPGKIDIMNEEYPSWLLRDPFSPADTKSASLRITENESLLAIIHGYGANDWRDQQATQTFVLKNVVGSNFEVHGWKEFIKAHTGKKLPKIRGDLIGNTLHGSRGYVYYAAATYRWFDPTNFKGEPRRGPFHGAMARKS